MNKEENTANIQADSCVEENLLTAREMADCLGIKVGTLKDWTKLKENPCPCYRYKSRILRFERAEVLGWFKGQTSNWKNC